MKLIATIINIDTHDKQCSGRVTVMLVVMIIYIDRDDKRSSAYVTMVLLP